MDLLETFQQHIQRSSLLTPARPFLLAVSGGIDSVVLAELCHDAGFSFAIAHCNFQLRGAESDGDADFVMKLAKRLGVDCFVTSFDTKQFAQQQGLSTQMAARQLRYEWFETLRKEHEFSSIVTAHHKNDAVETLIINLIRGTGLAGLTGIAARNQHIVRPLLFATRAEIAEYAAQKQLPWREDSSNASTDYARNYIRHQVIPEMEQLNPSLVETIGRHLPELEGAQRNLRFLVYQFLGLSEQEESWRISKSKLLELPDYQQVLNMLLKPAGFYPEQVRQVAEHLEETGLILESETGFRVSVERQELVLSDSQEQGWTPVRIEADDLMVSLPQGGRMFLMLVERPDVFPDGKEEILLDAAQLQFPVHLRPWRAGDHFQPFGMKGQRQKLQDLFTNLKLSQAEKQAVMVLENGDRSIIWVCGYRMDERFRVGERTEKCLKLLLQR